jgi:hypothetical protein
MVEDGGTDLELGITGMLEVSVITVMLVETTIDVELGNRGVGLDRTLDEETAVESGMLVESGISLDSDTLALLVKGMSKLEELGVL